ncbi:MAG: DUF4160 domain-containing protein [Bacillota bacterium]
MPIICMLEGIKIEMYFDDHNPPHFHATYGDDKAIVSITEATIMQGKLPIKKLKILLGWTVLHEDELMDMWNTQSIHRLEGFR